MEKVQVFIVGAGPSRLATTACLSKLSIPYTIAEREDCIVSLWHRHTYDCLQLHIPKEYMEDYVKHLNISPKFNTSAESCMYGEVRKCWVVMTHNKVDVPIMYASKFLVLATSENVVGYVPEIVGLQSFPGETIHSSSYKSGNDYVGKSVLIVGCGNSGLEIAHDLAVHGANTSIIIRSPLHVMTKELIHVGMVLSTWHLPLKLVDFILMILAYQKTDRSAVIDTGTTELIKNGDIKVFGPISCIQGNLVEFADGNERYYYAIVFATGYKSTANMWLKNDMSMLSSDGIPRNDFPNHWKGANGLYCIGFGRRGLVGIAHDANIVASDIHANMEMAYFN
ncbi:hypothetical protein VPH35_120690 [Triticum aestivum]